jgi:Bacterial Ig domain/Glucodextranase, domain B
MSKRMMNFLKLLLAFFVLSAGVVYAAPTVSITAPANNAVFVAPASITINANAAASSGTVSKVDFYNGATKIGTDITSPYSLAWTNVAVGAYTVTAKATDSAGAVTTSTAITVKVNANVAPTISITAPANNATLAAPANITINANATDSDGTIGKVEFFNGTTLLGTDTTAPYSFSWTNVVAGTYSITAKATDDKGAVTTSSVVKVTVGANKPPTVSITSPAANASFTAPATITINANAADTDGTITKVEFFNGTTLLGTDTTSPYSFAWTNVAAGSYAITAKATDDKSAVTTSAVVNIVVSAAVANKPPTVSITSPTANASFTAPAAITINANAADTDGTISKVEFFNGTTSLGSDTTSPYSFGWTNVAAGNYSITAKATDDKGAVTTSSAITIAVVTAAPAIAVEITKPLAGASFWTGHMDIAGNVTLSPGATLKLYWNRNPCGQYPEFDVELPVTLAGSQFTGIRDWNPTQDYPPACIRAVVKASDGKTAQSSVSNFQYPQASVAIVSPIDNALFYTPTIVVEAKATIPPSGRVEINGVVATLTGASFKATIPLTAAANQITANVMLGTDILVTSSPVSVTYTAPIDRTLTINYPKEGEKRNFNTVEASYVAGTVAGVDATTIIIRDTFGSMHIVDVQNGAFSAAIPISEQDNWIEVTAYGPGGATAKKQIHFYATTSTTDAITMTSPTACSNITPSPTNITLSALTRSAYPITKVNYMANGIQVGSSTTPPFDVQWSGVVASAYDISAQLFTDGSTIAGYAGNPNQAVAKSSEVKVTIGNPSAAPTCALTSPQNNVLYGLGASVTLTATATAASADGSISKVEFFDGSTLLTSLTAPPYEYRWTVANAGTHTINVKATDNRGYTASCATAQIQVSTNRAPVISIPGSSGVVINEGEGVDIKPGVTGTVVKVQLREGTTMLLETTTAPFTLKLLNLTAGTHRLFARAFDNLGLSGDSNDAYLTVNAYPKVVFNTPADNSNFNAPATIPISLDATDGDGSVDRVELYTVFANGGSTLLTTLTTAPYTYSWANLPAGTYRIGYKVFDNLGAALYGGNTVQNGPLINVKATGNGGPPAVTLTAPVNNTTVGSPVTLTLNAQNIAGTIATVEFLDGNKQIIGYNINAASSNYTLNYIWENATSGTHTLTAQVSNSAGVTLASTPVTVTVRAAPTVSLSAAGSFYLTPANVDLLIGAAAVEPGATLSRVEIYSGTGAGSSSNIPTTPVATLTSPPYRYRLVNAGIGTYSVFARAVDSLGSYRDSVPFVIRVGSSASVTVPGTLNGSTINSSTLPFAGTVNAPANSAITVNGVAATVSRDGSFVVNGVTLNAGVNSLTITATPPTGPTLTQTVSVTRTATPPSFELNVSPLSGVAPLEAIAKINNPGNTAFTTVLFSCNNPTGDVTKAEDQRTTLAGAWVCTFNTPGLYRPWVAIKDAAGTLIWTETKFVMVSDPLDGISIVRSVYSNMVEQLKAGNAAGALNQLSGDARSKYSTIFNAFGTDLATVVAQLGTIDTVTVSETSAEIVLIRDINATTKKSFTIHLVRGEDGVWRIESM